MIYQFLMFQDAQGGEAGNPLLSLLPIIVLFAVFYIFIIMPQHKKQKRMQLMISELQRGDKVITNGGIVGQIIGTKDDIIVIKTGENTKLEINRSFVAEKITDEIKTG